MSSSLRSATTLSIKVVDPRLVKYYQSLRPTADSGVDLIIPEDVTFDGPGVKFIDLGIQTKVSGIKGYDIVGRSSISKTPLMLANNIGIVDNLYRGNLKIALRAFEPYTITAGTRLVQLVQGDREPFGSIELVHTLDETSRGSGGFGSTGTH